MLVGGCGHDLRSGAGCGLLEKLRMEAKNLYHGQALRPKSIPVGKLVRVQ